MTDATSYLSEQQDTGNESIETGIQIAAAGGSVAVPTPSAGERIDIAVEPGQALDFSFDPASVPSLVLAEEGAVQFNFPDGGLVIIHGFQAWADAGGQANFNGQLADLAAAGVLPATAQSTDAAEEQVCETLEVPTAGPGEKLTIAAQPGQALQMTCDLAGVQGQEVDGDLMLTFPNGGVTVIEDFAEWAAATGATLNDCNCNAQNLPDVLASLGVGPDQIEPAAGQPTGGPQAGTDVTGSGFTPHPGPEILSGLPYPHILPPTALQYGVPFVEPTFFPVNDEAPRTVGEPSVSLDLAGEDTCVEEDSSIEDPNNVVTLTAAVGESDDELVELVITGFQTDWNYDFSGLDNGDIDVGASDLDASDGEITIVFKSGVTSYTGTFAVEPPADSDVDHPTLTAEVTAQDTVDNSKQASAQTTLDIDVDAEADGPGDGLSVSISVDDDGPDHEFAPGETGTVSVSATFGDIDGSEAHSIVINIPDGFEVTEPLPAVPGGSAAVNVDGDVVITMNGTTAALNDYEFEVTAPDDIEDGELFTFTATAFADEDPATDHECDPEDNDAQISDSDSIYGGNAVGPEVALGVKGGDCLTEDTKGTLAFSATPQSAGDQISEIVISDFESTWSVDVSSLSLTDADGALVLNTDYTVSFVGGALTITFLILPNGEVSGEIDVTPANDSDVDDTLDISATAVDGDDSATTTENDVLIPVDAVADGPGGGPNGGLDVQVDVDDSGPEGTFSPNETGTVTVDATFGDIDGSETHVIVIDIPDGFTVTEPLPSAPGVTSAVVNGDGDVVITMNGTTASLSNYEIEVTAPGTIPDNTLFTFTATVTATEEATEEGPNGASGEECTEDNNEAQDTDSDTIYGGSAVGPEVALGVKGGDCLTEDTKGTLAFSATPQSTGDQISQIVISDFESTWTVDVASLSLSDDDGALTQGVDYTVSFVGGVLTIAFLILPNGEVNGEIDVTPANDSDVDDTLDISATAVDNGDSATTTENDVLIPVDAVADGPGGGPNGGLDVQIDLNDSGPDGEFDPGETGTVTVDATFGDVDGSETHVIVIDIPDGFVVTEPLPGGTGITSAVVNGSGDVVITMNGTTAALNDYEFEVTAPDSLAEGTTFTFTATVTATEEATVAGPNGASGEECTEDNNEATDSDTVGGIAETFPSAGTRDLLADEDDLATGVGDVVTGDNAPSNLTGTLPHDFDDDGAGTIDLASMDGDLAPFTSGGDAVTYNWDPATNTLTAATATTTVFVMQVNPTTGQYVFTLTGPVDQHTIAGAEDTEVTNTTFALTYTVTDGDGNTADGTVNVTIDDDVPILHSVQDAVMPNVAGLSVNGTYDASFGGDGFHQILVDLGSAGTGNSYTVTSLGLDANGNEVFQVDVDGATDFTFYYFAEYDTVNEQGEVHAFLDAPTGTSPNLSFATADEFFDLTVNSDGTYVFDLHDNSISQTTTLDFADAPAGNFDQLFIYNGEFFSDLGDLPPGATPDVIIDALTDAGLDEDVNTSEQGLAVENQNIDVDETITFEFAQEQPLVSFDVGKFTGNKSQITLQITISDGVNETTVNYTFNTVSGNNTVPLIIDQAFIESLGGTFFEFTTLEIKNIDLAGNPNDGSTCNLQNITFNQETLLSDLELNFDLTLVDGDGDTTTVPDALTVDLVGDGVSGNFTLTGTSAPEVLASGEGADTINGGTGGGDTIDYSNSDAGVNVNIGTNAVSGGFATGDVISNFENILGSDLGDTLTGSSGDNLIMGGAGADSIVGGAGIDTSSYKDHSTNLSIDLDNSGNATVVTGSGTDTLAGIENLIGGSGNDTLTGNNLANLLDGGEGNDRLDGQEEANTLTGGAGDDVFVISSIDATDIITDYSLDDDSIDLTALFTVGAGEDVNDYVRVDGSNLQVDADGGGDSFVTVATFSANPGAVVIVFDTTAPSVETTTIIDQA
jgi:hypothetical protein